MAEFEVGCSLDYWVHRPATLVFNIQAAQFARQAVVDEALTFTPASSIECATMPGGNRFVRAQAERGWLRAEYRATVRLDPLVTNPAGVHEVPVERLPLEVLTDLVRSYTAQAQSVVPQFLAASFEMLRNGQSRMLEQLTALQHPMASMPGFAEMQRQQQAFLRAMMAGWTGPALSAGDPSPSATRAQSDASPSSEAEDIRRQLAELQARISRL